MDVSSTPPDVSEVTVQSIRTAPPSTGYADTSRARRLGARAPDLGRPTNRRRSFLPHGDAEGLAKRRPPCADCRPKTVSRRG